MCSSGMDPLHVTFYAPHIKSYVQCIRPREPFDKLASWLRLNGHWKDCDNLPALWDWVPRQRDGQEVFVDIGANIGSCALLMLAKGVRTIAFEPLPANQRFLSASARANGRSFREQLVLHPCALGSSSTHAPLFVSPENAGNSVVGRPIGDSSADQERMARAAMVRVRTLDEMLWPSRAGSAAPLIPLMKLDAQGYELHVLKGARRLLSARAISAIRFEVAPNWLNGQNSSARELYDLLTWHGFALHPVTDETVLRADFPGACATREQFEALDRNPHPLSIVDFLAILILPGALPRHTSSGTASSTWPAQPQNPVTSQSKKAG